MFCIALYFFVDGSPSSGFEALAVVESAISWDCESSKTVTRMLALTYMGYGHMSLLHKAYSFLWCVFLECGADLNTIRWKLSRIRGFTTDRGTERGLADMHDVLPDLCESLGLPASPRGKYLFPRVCWFPGWHHLLDNIIQDTLQQFPWFAKWLARLKCLIRFLRIDTYRQELVDRVTDHDYDVTEFKQVPPSFAGWRWDTLLDVLNWLVSVWVPLKIVFDLEVFVKKKQGPWHKRYGRCLTSTLGLLSCAWSLIWLHWCTSFECGAADAHVMMPRERK